MKNRKIRKCPFCSKSVKDDLEQASKLNDGKWMLHHYCPNDDMTEYTTISIVAESKERLIEKWNARAYGPKKEMEDAIIKALRVDVKAIIEAIHTELEWEEEEDDDEEEDEV